MRSRHISVTASITIILGTGAACIPHYEVSVKNAFMMYGDRKFDLGPPLPHRAAYAYSKREDPFVSDLRVFVNSGHRKECLYCLGWFGDTRDLPVTYRFIRDPDPETARVALFSFGNLARQQFSTPEMAEAWWSSHRIEFELPAPIKGK